MLLPGGCATRAVSLFSKRCERNGSTDDASMTYRQQVWLRDDDFAARPDNSLSHLYRGCLRSQVDAVLEAIDENAHVLVLVDACHSGAPECTNLVKLLRGTICDFNSGLWLG